MSSKKMNKFRYYIVLLVILGMVMTGLLYQWYMDSNDIHSIEHIDSLHDMNSLTHKRPPWIDMMNDNTVKWKRSDLMEYLLRKEYISIPGHNRNKRIFVMNTIYLSNERIIAIFLLGSKMWFSSDKNGNYYENIKKDWNSDKDKLYCLFEYDNDIFYETRVQFVPEALYSSQSSIILLCNIPNEIVIHSKNDFHEFILYSKDKNDSFSLELSFNIKNNTVFPINTKRIITNKNDFLTVCMSSIREPMPWITENIAYLISQGIEHIYIGTYFNHKNMTQYTNDMIKMLKPWYDKGLISLFNFIMPEPLHLTNKKYAGQPQFLDQCLYLAKSFGDEFTLNIDADEFIVFHNRKTIYNELSTTYYNDIKNKCWVVFPSYNMYNLTNINSNYLVPRYTTLESPKLVDFYDRCKVLWNVKYLWNSIVHAGGACNINGFNWTLQIWNWKHKWLHDHKRKIRQHNSTYLVKIMDGETEASIRHYNNAMKPRKICANKTINDSYTTQFIWNNIQNEFNKHNFNYTTFTNNTQKYNILFNNDYINLFGKMSPMNKSVYIGCKRRNNKYDSNYFIPKYYDNKPSKT